MKNFHDLLVWQKVHQLTLDTYTATQDFPREEQYSFVRRSTALPS
jgi:hypothetical protein